MRPARKGPEKGHPAGRRGSAPPGFNEAGPQGTGKITEGGGDDAAGHAASMRPARKGPEKWFRLNLPSSPDLPASMRPARKGPEKTFDTGAAMRRVERFNEAGPQGTGKSGT